VTKPWGSRRSVEIMRRRLTDGDEAFVNETKRSSPRPSLRQRDEAFVTETSAWEWRRSIRPVPQGFVEFARAFPAPRGFAFGRRALLSPHRLLQRLL
jgi:hypothetical protein